MKGRQGGDGGGGDGQPESALVDPIYTTYCMRKKFFFSLKIYKFESAFYMQPALLDTFVRLASPATRCSAMVNVRQRRPGK